MIILARVGTHPLLDSHSAADGEYWPVNSSSRITTSTYTHIDPYILLL
jgi:hypothetical protein